jgi:hypothetical protein
MLLAGLAIGLGMLTKGTGRPRAAGARLPVGEPGHGRRPAADAARLVRACAGSTSRLATLVLLAVALPWFLAMAEVHGTAYLRRFFIGENLERFATERYNGRRPLWFYAPIIFGGLAPWSSLMVLWIPSVGRVLRGVRRLTGLEWRLILWAVVPVLFYTLSVGQQPRYILPVLPPLAVLVAPHAGVATGRERGRGPARRGGRHRDHRQRARLPRPRVPAVPGTSAAVRAVAAAGPDRHGHHRRRRGGAARLDVVRPAALAAGGGRRVGRGHARHAAVHVLLPAPAPSRCS